MRGECAILTDVITLIIDCVKVLASNIKNSTRRARQGIFALVAVMAIVASLSFNGTRIAYKVNYSGSIIATVSQKKHFNDALQLVAKLVGNDDVKNKVSEPVFSATVVLDESINNTQELASAIIDNTDDILEGTTLYINGEKKVTAEKDLVDSIMNTCLNRYNVDGAQCKSYFDADIKTENGFYMAHELDSDKEVKKALEALNVITEVREISNVIVPYTTQVKKSDEHVKGYEEIAVKGVSGINSITKDLLLVNGEIKSSDLVGTQILVDPIDEVVIKGTAKNASTAQQNQEAHNSGFSFPLPQNSWQVSAYYGDGRSHKAIDLRAPSGTKIYAVSDGRVVFAGWDGNYGYRVIIEHSNGIRTGYAHARTLCCKVGDIVSQGEVVALVGTTGQSTGNHLHFEVMVNGVKVNPAPYINLD